MKVAGEAEQGLGPITIGAILRLEDQESTVERRRENCVEHRIAVHANRSYAPGDPG